MEFTGIIGGFTLIDPMTKRWDDIVCRSASFDVYHTSSYHRAAVEGNNASARLFVYAHKGSFVALPLVLVRNESDRATPGAEVFDATSVYGYAGPICSHRDLSPLFLEDFCGSLERCLLGLNIASASSRLHPFLPGRDLIRSLGKVEAKGQTVYMDLRTPDDIQRSQYRENHRRDLVKLAKLGYATALDLEFRYLDDFIRLYHQHMDRIGADSRYFFGDRYFYKLREELGSKLCLFVCRHRGQVAGGGLFFVCNEYAQYHLGAVARAHVECSPLKQVIDAARREFSARKCAVLHLGGGLGANDDLLFHFKAGFSKHRQPFHTWQWRAQEASAYRQQTAAPRQRNVYDERPAVLRVGQV